MSKQHWLVLAVESEEQDQEQGHTLWRVRVRAPEKTEPTYVVYVSQSSERAAPYAVGTAMQMDARLLSVEQEQEGTTGSARASGAR